MLSMRRFTDCASERTHPQELALPGPANSAESPEECLQVCAADAQCMAYAFGSEGGGTCDLCCWTYGKPTCTATTWAENIDTYVVPMKEAVTVGGTELKPAPEYLSFAGEQKPELEGMRELV